jgi:N-acetyl-gamma-glutamyl-phosphate reductase
VYNDSVSFSVGIIGASGYGGAEFMRLMAGHSELDLAWATGDTQSGVKVSELYPSMIDAYPDATYRLYDATEADGLDVVVLALPHGKSQELVPDLLKRAKHVVDLAADFRLKDASLYPTWYGEPHGCPELLKKAVYGLPEIGHRAALAKGPQLIAVPGCYPTAASLALRPLVQHGAIEPTGVIVNAGCGVSGAGRTLKHGNLYGTVAENFEAYGLLTHRHTPEMEQNTGAQVLFTPHLLPMTRGILATCYAKPSGKTSTKQLLALLSGVYGNEPFVRVIDGSPSTKATFGTNLCIISARFDERTNTVIVLSAIDNLVKGTAGGAIQSLNLALGLPETMGLPTVAVYP